MALINISYMGTKRQIAPHVKKIVARYPPGPFLDLFSGIGTVGSAISSERPIWCNDTQTFAELISRLRFKSLPLSKPADHFVRTIERLTQKNFEILCERFGDLLEMEAASLSDRSLTVVINTETHFQKLYQSQEFKIERRKLALQPKVFPYRLFTLTYIGGYFGAKQSMEIDSIRFAIDTMLGEGSMSKSDWDHACAALCAACCACSTTTGHFAQYLTPNTRNLARFIAQRNRSLISDWRARFEHIANKNPIRHRHKNKIYRMDAISLLRYLRRYRAKPKIVYADPPYTSDHYSRYYHLYETLILYDYPETASKGRYRPDRFWSEFCYKRKAEQAFEELIRSTSELGATLILSYPQNGLVANSKFVLGELFQKYFGGSTVHEIDHFHSSLGGPKGHEKKAVTEVVYASPP